MLDYSYPLYFRNWKTGRSGRGGGDGVGRGRGPRSLPRRSRAQRMKISASPTRFPSAVSLELRSFCSSV